MRVSTMQLSCPSSLMKSLISAPGCGPNSGCPPQVINPFLEEEVEDLKPHFPRAPDESDGDYRMRILDIIERSDRMVEEYEYEMKATDALGELLEDSHYFENDGANWGFE